MPPDTSLAESLAFLAARFADLAARTQTVDTTLAAEAAKSASTFDKVLGMLDKVSVTIHEIQLATHHAEKQPMQAPSDTPPVTPPPSPLHLAQTVFGSYDSSQRPTTNTTAPLAIESDQTIIQRLPRVDINSTNAPQQPSPISVLDPSFYKEDESSSSSPSPVLKRSIDFKDLPVDIAGLRDEIHTEIDMFHPTTLPQAMDLARLTEQKLSSPRPRLFEPRPIPRSLALLPTPTVARATPVGFPSKRLTPTLFQCLVLEDVPPENEEGSGTLMEDMSLLPQDAPTVECLNTPEQLNEVSNLLKIGTKIICVGCNYAAHATELGNAIPKEPVLFMKPTSAYLENGGTIEIPESYESLDHEEELAVVISKKARDVPKANAVDYVGGYAFALDMTARELQSVAKSAGLSWTMAKGPPIIQCLSRHQAIQYSMFQLTLVSITELHYPNFNLEVEVSVKGGSNVAPLIDKGPVDDLADLGMTRGFSKCKIEISKGVHGMSMAWRIS